MNEKNLKTGIKLFFLVAMACFFFPFAMVSCSGESVEATGFELATNISMHEEIKFDDEDVQNPYLIAGFICGALGFCIAWKLKKRDKKALVSGCFATAGAMFLLLFRSTFWSFYKLTGYEGQVTVEFRWGWILSLIAYIGAAVASFLAYWSDAPNDNIQSGISQHLGSMADSYVQPNALPDSASESIEDKVQQINISTKMLFSDKALPQSDAEAPDQLAENVYLPQIVIRGRFKGGEVQEWQPEKFPCLIGRDPSVAQVAVSDSCASRIHAILYIESGALMIEDEQSSNGTYVNGEKISSPVELLTGDEVKIGEAILLFEVSE